MNTARQDTPHDQRILTARDGPIASVVFNNPARHNAMSMTMWQGLEAAMTAYAGDDQVRAVVLSGAGGRAFVSGADISEFESQRDTADGVEIYNRATETADAAVFHFPKPVIAKIRGYCIGGGLGIALGCDIRICSEESTFGIPAAKLGLGYGYDGVKTLVDLVGPSRAMEIFYTARQFDAGEALQMGLVNQVVPDADLDAAVDAVTDRIGANAPMTLAAVKETVRECAKPSADRDLARMARLIDDCYASTDYEEGRKAFMEKRKPAFKGR